MAKSTYLQLVNKVLKRITQPEIVSGVSSATGQAKIIAEMINEAQIELWTDTTNWHTLYKQRNFDTVSYTSDTISFNNASPATIVDSSNGFGSFQDGQTIVVNGSTFNNGAYVIETATANTLTLQSADALTDEEEGTTNLLTENQASVETNTSGFVGHKSTETLTQDLTLFWDGMASLKTVTPGSVIAEGCNTAPQTAVTPSDYVSGSVYLQGSGTCYLRLREWNSITGFIADTFSPLVTLTGAWQRVEASNLFGATGDRAQLIVAVDGTQAATIYTDGWQLEQKGAVTTWQNPGDGARAGATVTIHAVTYPLASDHGRTIDLVDMNNDIILVEDVGRSFDEYDPDMDYTNNPYFFSIQGTHYRLFYVPNSDITILDRYWKVPTALSADTDTSDLPEFCENFLIHWAWMSICDYLNKFDVADRIRLKIYTKGGGILDKIKSANSKVINQTHRFQGRNYTSGIHPPRFPSSYQGYR